MRRDHVTHLVCPQTGRSLEIDPGSIFERERVREGSLIEPVSGNRYPVVDFIPRFVPAENYASNFGLQWNTYDRTQHDSASGASVSGSRFQEETRWPSRLSGERILEVGCGSGRFTGHALDTDALVVSFDYSAAVDAVYRAHGERDNLLLVQASIYQMPFAARTFDRAFCFGVLQHTPDPERSFLKAVECVKPGGHFASDVYVKDLRHWLLHTKYWVRPFVDRSNPEKLHGAVRRYIDWVWPLAKRLRRIPKLGRALNWRLLVADHSQLLPDADDAQLKEWAYLDTFDMLSPVYDQPQTLTTFRRWHQDAGLVDIDVRYGYNGIEGRGVKRVRAPHAQK